MRVLVFGMAVAVLIGCAPVQRQFNGFEVAFGACKNTYHAWQSRIEESGTAAAGPAAAQLLACMRGHGVQGPITLVVRDVYGAFGPSTSSRRTTPLRRSRSKRRTAHRV